MEAKVKEANALFLQGKHSPAVALYTAAIEAGSPTATLLWYFSLQRCARANHQSL
jgi:hypothetical protein